ncbi:MAG: transcriptional regulator, GntR family [Rhizobacter sp.]|nr:transcriptional regulator, GntR family [Rhizobacter sp.]
MKTTEDAIYRTLSTTLLAGRLAPGTPLREVQLAEVFGVSRERIRKILLRLGTNRLIEQIPNRGAFVAAPSLEQARDIYEARRILEGGIVGHLAPSLSEQGIAELSAHLELEEAALEAGDRAESVRLSAEFHIILARATGSEFVVQQLQELVSRTSMLVALFESARSSHCACEEHRAIFTPLIAGDGAGAMKAMQVHLSLVETRLRPSQAGLDADPIVVLTAAWEAQQ